MNVSARPHFLLDPLVERAVASAQIPSLGFLDSAAEVLADKLGVQTSQRDFAFKKIIHNAQAVLRCKWIDQQLNAFFTEHPEGTAVELGAGFSTRFHRLSYSQEWPKFSWVAVDSKDVLKSVRACFPNIDNHDFIECDQRSTQWLALVRTRPNMPCVAVIERRDKEFSLAALKNLCGDLIAAFGHAHLILDLDESEIILLEKQFGEALACRSSYALQKQPHSFFRRMFSRPAKRYERVCHLALGRETNATQVNVSR